MPLCFAYGSNMDVAAMAARCPRSRALGVARLLRHRFFVMEQGYASVRRDPTRTVWGALWDIALSDMRALDAYENVAGGLYVKAQQSVLVEGGGSRRALVYLGASRREGAPLPGYMEGVLAAAEAAGLPDAYRRELAGWAPAGAASTLAPAERPKVRPRFASPLDRR